MVQSASPLNSPSLKFRSGLRYFYLYIFYSGGAILNRAPRSGLSSCPSRKPSAQAVSNCSIFTLSFFFFSNSVDIFFQSGCCSQEHIFRNKVFACFSFTCLFAQSVISLSSGDSQEHHEATTVAFVFTPSSTPLEKIEYFIAISRIRLIAPSVNLKWTNERS